MADQEGQKRQQFYIPIAQLEALKKLGVITGETMSEQVREAIDRYIKDTVSRIKEQKSVRRFGDYNIPDEPVAKGRRQKGEKDGG